MVDTAKLDELVLLINKDPSEDKRRKYLAKIVEVYGRGGAARVHSLTGVALSTLRRGRKDNQSKEDLPKNRMRRTGAGRKSVESLHPEITEKLERMIDGDSYGSPNKELSWIPESLSLRKMCERLKAEASLVISHVKVGQIIAEMGYSRHVNQTMLQVGKESPNRDLQFEHINKRAHELKLLGFPVLSVDSKKIENLDHYYPLEELGKVAPFGIYVINDTIGFANLGIDNDTAEFASMSIGLWWDRIGSINFPNAKSVYIICDGGVSNGSKNKLWKYELQKLANRTGLSIEVSHYPPGTSKWKRIEHRTFCYISKNLQGKPLINVETAVDLIPNSTIRGHIKAEIMKFL